MEEVKHPGVFQRGNVWWYSTGRGVRRSSRSTDVHEAIRQREHALAFARHRSCSAAWRSWVAAQRADADSWLRRTHTRMKRKTAARGWLPCITLEEMTSMVLASDGKCALTGLPFSFAAKDPFSISIDRADSARGYYAGNVRVVLLAVNLAMSHWGEESLLRISRALVGRELLRPATDVAHAKTAILDVTA